MNIKENWYNFILFNLFIDIVLNDSLWESF